MHRIIDRKYEIEEMIALVSLRVDSRFSSPRWTCRQLILPESGALRTATFLIMELQAETRLRQRVLCCQELIRFPKSI